MHTRRLGLFLCFLATVAVAQPAADRQADHQQLREMLARGTAALNARDFDALAAMFEPNCYITTADGKAFHSVAAFKTYLDDLYRTRVSSIKFNPVADELTTFFDDDSGACIGASTDTYTFKDGDTRTMTSRWTATVHKSGAQWKVASLHMSANILDNPVVGATKRYGYMAAAGALAIGLILGFLLRMVTTRRA